MSNCQPLEVVYRGSETQLQVGENLNKLRVRIAFYKAFTQRALLYIPGSLVCDPHFNLIPDNLSIVHVYVLVLKVDQLEARLLGV